MALSDSRSHAQSAARTSGRTSRDTDAGENPMSMPATRDVRGQGSRVSAVALASVLVACVAFAPRPAAAVSPSGEPTSSFELPGSPVAPVEIELVQPNGARFRAIPWGDRRSSGYETPDGFTVQQDARGVWRFVHAVDQRGRPQLSAQRPEAGPPDDNTPRHLRVRTDGVDVAAPAPPGGAFTGVQPALVILVQFANRSAVGSTAVNWHNRFFGPTGSVADYYREVSYGSFSVSPASETHGTPNDGIAGWVTLPYNHPNTGVTPNGAWDWQIVRDAVLAVDPWVNFAAYDTNANGRIETRELHVTVIAAGYETAYGGTSGSCAPGVWGHQWTVGVTVAAPVVDGKTVAGHSGGGYTMFGEWHCSNTDTPGDRK